jgi:hypothetical protein
MEHLSFLKGHQPPPSRAHTRRMDQWEQPVEALTPLVYCLGRGGCNIYPEFPWAFVQLAVSPRATASRVLAKACVPASHIPWQLGALSPGCLLLGRP